MTNEQKQRIIGAYNVALDRQIKAEERMDASKTDKAWQKAANDHSFALGEQSGISWVVKQMGFKLILDDEERAVDVKQDAEV